MTCLFHLKVWDFLSIISLASDQIVIYVWTAGAFLSPTELA